MKQREMVKVRKVGTSVVVTLPERAREIFNVKLGDMLEVVAFKGRVTYRLVVKPSQKKTALVK